MNSIRIGIFMICIVLCVPYMASCAEGNENNNEKRIAYVREQHFPGYSAADGYPTIGEALEKFFSKGVWKYEYDQYVSFTGIAQISETNARFKWIFSFTPKTGTSFDDIVLHGNVQVNGIRVTDREFASILAAVMLN